MPAALCALPAGASVPQAPQTLQSRDELAFQRAIKGPLLELG